MRLRHVVCAAAALWLAGCVAGPAPRDHFYRLETPAPARLEAPLLQGTLRVERLRTDALTDERRLLVREAPGAAEIHPQPYDYWVDPPGQLLRNALTRYLEQAGVADRVLGSELRVHEDFSIGGRVRRLELLRGQGRVAVELELSLTRSRDRELLLLATYLEEVPVEGDSTAAAARAMGRATGAIFARLLADMADLPH